MNRRDFMKLAAPAMGIPLILPVQSLKASLLNNRRAVAREDGGRVLVLIQLAGGNDGLNTIIPYPDPDYYKARPQLAISQSDIIDLNGRIGLNNALKTLLPLWNAGQLAIIQGVGYSKPNRSHFRSTDIWETASDSDIFLNTGWLGRYLDLIYPEDSPWQGNGPPAIEISRTASLALLGSDQKGIALDSPQQFYDWVYRLGKPHESSAGFIPETPAEKELEFLRDTEAAAFEFAGEIMTAWKLTANLVEYPRETLADQLSIVARLIAGGLDTKIYIVKLGGFDTHANQAPKHTGLLKNLATAVSIFQQDLQLLNIDQRVTSIIYSEFGRRVAENAGLGTDHGTAAPLFLLGNSVRGGIYNDHPSLTDLDQGDLKYSIDFKQIYATVLEQWFNHESTSVLGRSFATLPIFSTSTSIKEIEAAPNSFQLFQNYPNPFNPQTTIQYNLTRSVRVKLDILNTLGQQVEQLVNETQSAGCHTIVWTNHGLKSGNYFLRLKAGNYSDHKKMMILK